IGCDHDVLEVTSFEQPFPAAASIIDEVDQVAAYADGTLRTNAVTLSWTGNSSSDFLAYQILRTEGDPTGDFEIVGSVNDQSVTTFTDSDLSDADGDVEYSYIVATMLASGTSKVDTVEVKTPLWDQPSDVVANARTSDTCRLTWTDNSESEAGFKIYIYDHDLSVDVPEDSLTVGAGVTEANFEAVNTDFRFTLVAENDFEEPMEETSKVRFEVTSGTPGVHTWATQLEGTADIFMSWTDNSTRETKFEIERSIGNILTFTLLDEVDYNVTEYTDTDLTLGTMYYYRVRAVNTVEDPDWESSYRTLYFFTGVTVQPFEFYTSFEDGSLPDNMSVGGDASWAVVADEDAPDGDFVLQAGEIGNDQECYVEFTTDELFAGEDIDFRYKISSESSHDYLRFYIDGELEWSQSGDYSWSSRTEWIPAGEHVLRWAFEKDDYDYTANTGDDTAWIDLINLW
ncbi:MAG: fibronectin type III domain-containing protein, partial [Gemmatimonadales bacterium]|nr:fibronectin type III domain-containing protein [Gemmatimonadales bacterium]